jgi:hypothetical protein
MSILYRSLVCSSGLSVVVLWNRCSRCLGERLTRHISLSLFSAVSRFPLYQDNKCIFRNNSASYAGEEPDLFHEGNTRDRVHQCLEGTMTYYTSVFWAEKTDALLLTVQRIYTNFLCIPKYEKGP